MENGGGHEGGGGSGGGSGGDGGGYVLRLTRMMCASMTLDGFSCACDGWSESARVRDHQP